MVMNCERSSNHQPKQPICRLPFQEVAFISSIFLYKLTDVLEHSRSRTFKSNRYKYSGHVAYLSKNMTYGTSVSEVDNTVISTALGNRV